MSRTPTTRTRGRAATAVAVVALVALATVVPAVALGASGPANPQPPASYYGQATLNGQPVSAGTQIVAYIDGERRGAITADANGDYGGADAFADKLTVNGTAADEGKTVSFTVGGVPAKTTVQWFASDLQRVDLTAYDAAVGLRVAANVSTYVAGRDAKVTVTRADTGAPVDATLRFDGSKHQTGADGNVTLTLPAAGDYWFNVSHPPTQSFEYADANRSVSVLAPPNFDVDYSVSATDVYTTDPVTVSATVENTGGVAGDHTVEFTVDGSPVDSKTVTVGAGETETVDFVHRFQPAGTSQVAVDGQPATAVTSEAPTNPDATLSLTRTRELYGSADVRVDYALSHVSTGVDHLAYSLDGGAPTTVSDLTKTSLTLSGLADGEHTLSVWLVDNLGNRLVETDHAFAVDTAAPALSVSVNHTANVSVNNHVAVTVTASDAGSGVDAGSLDVWSGATTPSDLSTQPASELRLPGDITGGTATAVWNATTVVLGSPGAKIADGDHNATVVVTDAAGNTNATNVTLSVDNTPPSVSVGQVGTAAQVSKRGTDRYANGTVTVSGTSSGAESVTLVLSSKAASYRNETTVTPADDGSWTATVNASRLSLTGDYYVNARAADAADNTVSIGSGYTLVADTRAPTLHATLTQTGKGTGAVTVSADEPLQGNPTVSLTAPDDSDLPLSLSKKNGKWVADGITLSQDGTYTLGATGTDRAGNQGTASASADVQTVSSTDEVTFTTDNGTEITLHFESSASGYGSLTSSETPLANLSANLVGAGFLHGELSSGLSTELDYAVIRIPADQVSLPEGVDPSDIEVRRYNPDNHEWEQSFSEADGTTTYDAERGHYVRTVTGFSTYGAVASDTVKPTVKAPTLSPSQSGTYDYDTDSVTVTVPYEDLQSGIDPSAVTVTFDGQDVTEKAATSITGSQASYTATDLHSAESHTVTVTAADNNGNEKSKQVNFDVEQDADAPSLTASYAPTESGPYAYGTDSVDLRVDYSDALSGVDTGSVSVSVDGSDVTGSATVTKGYVEYTLSGLSSGDSVPVSVSVADGAGNPATFSDTVDVAADTDAPALSGATLTAADGTTRDDGMTFPSGTSRVTVHAAYTDALSGVDPGSVTATFDGTPVTGSAVVTQDGLTYTATGLSDGTDHTLSLTLVDAASNSRSETVSFGVATPHDGGGDGYTPPDSGTDTSDEGDTDAGTGSNSQSPGSVTRPPDVSVGSSPTAVSVSTSAVAAGQSVDVDFADADAASATGVDLSSMSVTAASETSLNLSVRASADAASTSAGGSAAPSAGADALAYFSVDHAVAEDALADVTFEFGVRADTLDAAGTDPENVVLYRYHDGSWNRLSTRLVNRTDDGYRFRATSPGLSVFAVRAGVDHLDVTGADLSTDETTAGSAVDVTATVANAGGASGSKTVALSVDGEVVERKTVTVGADGTATVTFTHRFAAGDHDVSVAGTEAGTLAVAAQETTATTTRSTSSTTPADTTNSGGTPGFTLAGALVALLALFALAAVGSRD